MKRALIAFFALTLVMTGCSRKNKQPASLQATATGAAIVESSGGKQIGYVGMPMDQPIVVQVNDAAGSAVAGAAVYFSGPSGVSFTPASALTDSSGQVISRGIARPASWTIQNHRPYAGWVRQKPGARA